MRIQTGLGSLWEGPIVINGICDHMDCPPWVRGKRGFVVSDCSDCPAHGWQCVTIKPYCPEGHMCPAIIKILCIPPEERPPKPGPTNGSSGPTVKWIVPVLLAVSAILVILGSRL